ncbi:hypothetical protein BDQ12DRAFT_412280 [Crucibulum laeve]|uniref:Uncharacterized protein n=1 Tax=Crucibulum laeve TaxID=68775 RepID=A0A5C3M8Y1_9AGAR|nr:hypothetical protein BDQ12DRAFT_412280 [Crucibulum laeve]
MGLLTKGGLFQQLKDQVAQLTVDYNLDRKYNPKYYFGREQLQIMFTEMLNASGRLAILHQIERMLFTFYMTARPSSLGPVHEIWRKRGYGVCLKHVRVCVLGYMNFRITVHLDEFKGAISGVSADEQRFVLEGVLYMHNLLFDPTIYMVAMLYGRNAFQKKYKSINDLCNDNQAELVIDSSMLQEPLFPEIAPGGSHREFITPLRPALAQAATKSVAYWAQKAGLPCTGVTALRRDAGNMYGLQLGTDKAQDIMNHVGSDRRIFSTHYDRGTANVDVVHIRLGERPGTKENNAGEMLEESARTHSFMDIVVECLLRRNAVAPGHKAEIDVQCNKAAEEDPELIALEDEKQQLYEQYLRCFSHGAKSYKFCIDNVHRIFEFAAGERKQYPRRDPVSFIEGCKLEASELRNKLRVSFDKAANRRYQIKKKFRRRIQQNTTRSYAESPLTGTTEERTTAINDAHKPSTHLVSALMAPPTGSFRF